MIGNFFLKALMIIISLIDFRNKTKILNFFKTRFKKELVTVFDIGAHKGETIDLFYKNFNINNIYSFEPNINLFHQLINKKKYKINKIKIFNLGFGEITETKELNIFNDTSSSTLNNINENTKYFKRKKRLMSFFFGEQSFLKEKQTVKISNLSEFISNNAVSKIDILKIDTEGYEYKILKGLKDNDFKRVKFLYFEHHYDLMISKGYKFSDINKLLKEHNFKQKYKIRMKFRKSFEYIYENAD